MKRWEVFQKESDFMPVDTPMLFDLEADIGEQKNLAEKHPDKVAELVRLAEQAREDIGDYDRVGKNARFFDPGPRRADIEAWK